RQPARTTAQPSGADRRRNPPVALERVQGDRDHGRYASFGMVASTVAHTGQHGLANWGVPFAPLGRRRFQGRTGGSACRASKAWRRRRETIARGYALRAAKDEAVTPGGVRMGDRGELPAVRAVETHS